MYADLMAFPFPQDSLMRKDPNLTVHKCVRDIELMHATSVPPPITDFATVISEHRWFKEQIKKAELSNQVVYGLQNPPAELNQIRVDQLRKEGVRFMCLSYTKENEYGGGFYTPEVRLSRKGVILVEQMIEAGMIVDLSHAGHQTAHDVLDLIEKKGLSNSVVATHSGCFAVYPHYRNLPDDVIRKISDMGGLIGLPTVTWLLSEEDNSLEPFLQHLDHLLRLVPENCVAIGSDGVYATTSTTEEVKHFVFMSKKLDPTGEIFHARLPEESFEIHGPQRMPILHALIARRFGEIIAKKITSENLCDWI